MKIHSGEVGETESGAACTEEEGEEIREKGAGETREEIREGRAYMRYGEQEKGQGHRRVR